MDVGVSGGSCHDQFHQFMPWSGVAPYVAEDVIHRRTCQENPSLEGIVTQQYAGYPQESCHFEVRVKQAADISRLTS